MSFKPYLGVAVLHPTRKESVAGLREAARSFHADLLATVGAQWRLAGIRDADLPLLEFQSLADLAEQAPLGCQLIGVGGAGAPSLSVFSHPDRALYLFGGSAPLSERVQRQWCTEVISVDTPGAKQLSAAIAGGIVMHHRVATERLGRAAVSA